MTNENLQVFSTDVIPVYVTDTGAKVVLGRELHEKLGLKARYNDWINNIMASQIMSIIRRLLKI